MNRRSFFAALAASTATAAFALDEERALWVPGRKRISIPSEIARPPRIVDAHGRVWVRDVARSTRQVPPELLAHMFRSLEIGAYPRYAVTCGVDITWPAIPHGMDCYIRLR